MKLEPEDIEACAAVVMRLMKPQLRSVEESIRELTETLKVSAKSSLPQPREQSPSTIVKGKELKELTGLSPTTIWRLEKDGRFPQRIQLSTNRVGWLRSEIYEWVAKRRTK